MRSDVTWIIRNNELGGQIAPNQQPLALASTNLENFALTGAENVPNAPLFVPYQVIVDAQDATLNLPTCHSTTHPLAVVQITAAPNSKAGCVYGLVFLCNRLYWPVLSVLDLHYLTQFNAAG
jgi:hypothetical protein